MNTLKTKLALLLKRISKFNRVKVIGWTSVAVLIWAVYMHNRPMPLWFANRVEAYRVQDPYQYEELVNPQDILSETAMNADLLALPHQKRMIDGYVVLNGPVNMNAIFASRVNTALLDPFAFQPTHNNCLINPAVVFRVFRGSHYQDTILCWHCGQIVTIDGKSGWYGTMGIGFASLAKVAFPNDPVIQKL